MNGPPRLLADPSATDFERDLLESWTSEAPSPGARARALALGGIAVGAVVTSAVGGAAAHAGAAGVAGAAAPVGLSGAAKLGIAAVLLLGSAMVSLAIVMVSDAPAPVVVPPPQATATSAEPGSATAVVEPPSVSPADLPTAASAAARPSFAAPAVPRASASAAARADTLSDEISSFESARASLERGDNDRTLALIDTYEARYPKGVFSQEAEVVRVRALAAKGDVAGARRAGERFLTMNPASPHAPRIRAILESSHP